MLERISAPTEVRLACQTRPSHDISIMPLLPPTATAKDALRRPAYLRGEEREIICDGGGEDRFTWSHIAFTPDKQKVIMVIQHDGDRRKESLALIDLIDPSFDYLITPRVERFSLEMLEAWLSETLRFDLFDLRYDAQVDFDDEDFVMVVLGDMAYQLGFRP